MTMKKGWIWLSRTRQLTTRGAYKGRGQEGRKRK
ncbi:hypothetical protein RDI58_021994 [Solanum bulbocastanum]|uniref:Uncharacterized protein n=1 Tax=Solanum bulbocastanum TaxID=147425 RepID=A0AAN8T184_SOLBU